MPTIEDGQVLAWDGATKQFAPSYVGSLPPGPGSSEYLLAVNNLSDVASAAAARTNLGLGTAALLNTGTASGNIPLLGSGGKLATSVLPAIAITDTFVVASQAAMLALSAAETGDVAVRSDLNKSFILAGTNPATLAHWQELLTPTDSVLSVNGQTGVVVLTKSDVGLGNVDNTSDATKNAATATLTNKTISGASNTLSNIGNSSLTNSSVTLGSTPVSLGGTVTTLAGLTLTTPTIASFANAAHSHQNAAGGGTLDAAAIASGTVATARLGSGTASSSTYLRGDQTYATPVTSIAGTANQVTASASTGAVTLSLPQNIHTGASPQFTGLTLTGNLSAAGVASSLVPSTTDTYDLGSSAKLWRKGWLSELDAVLFAQNTVSLIGGWLMATKNEGAIPVGQDVGTGDTTIDFGQAMTANDFVLFRAAGAVEYVQVGTLSAGTRYNVTRNLDGSGANAWPAGSVYAVLGNTTNGRIEINANATPRISLIKQGATYNAVTELVRVGDLNGDWGYSSETYGFVAGEYGAGKAWVAVDPTNGFRIGLHTTINGQWDASGNVTLGQVANNSGNAYWNNTTKQLQFRGGTGGTQVQAYIDTTGALTVAGGGVKLNSSGIQLTGNGSTYLMWLGSVSGSNAQYLTVSESGGKTVGVRGVQASHASHPAAESWEHAVNFDGTVGADLVLRAPSTGTTGHAFLYNPSGGTMRLGIGVDPLATTPSATLDVIGDGKFSGAVNSVTGFRYNGAATSGRVLRGDGTNFISAQLAASDLSNGVTGSGSAVLATSPTLVTPTLGAATASSLTVSAAQPILTFNTTGTTGKGRLTSLVGNWFGMTTNLSFDGSNWQADDPSIPGWVFKIDARNSSIFDRFEVGRIAPGATPAAAYTSHLAVMGTGSIVLGSAALATNATDGFLYIPTCAGTPTGTPTTHTGRAPVVIDTTNNKFCAYIGGAWRSVTLT